MEVFRLCYQNEIDSILHDKNFRNVGKKLKQDENKYLCFYNDKKDLFRFDCYKNMCFCTYDIPDDVLHESVTVRNFLEPENRRYYQKVTEYVVDTNKLKYSYLKDIEMLNYDLYYDEYEDYLIDKSFVKSLKKII